MPWPGNAAMPDTEEAPAFRLVGRVPKRSGDHSASARRVRGRWSGRPRRSRASGAR